MTGSEKQPQRQFTLKSNKQQLKLHKKKKNKTTTYNLISKSQVSSVKAPKYLSTQET